MFEIKKLKRFYLLIIFFAFISITIALSFFIFFRKEEMKIEIVDFRNATNQAALQDLFKKFNLDFYPLYLESYVVDYGIGNKTNWKRAYISIYVFDDPNKAKNFLNYVEISRSNATGNFSIFLLKDNKVMIVNFYENKNINYVIEYFKNK